LEPDKYDASRGHPKDKAFRLIASVNSTLEKRSRINWDGNVQEMAILEAGIKKNSGFYGCISLQEGLNSMVDKDLPQIDTPKSEEYQATFQKSELAWQDYWSKSVLSSR
jgi:alpha-L-fucosidase 2